MAKASPSAQTDFQRIITAHNARYPAMQLEDIYKLAHQACLGSGHAVSDKTHAQHRLEQELAQLGDGPAEPVLDAITPAARILRVHLRPFIASGGNVAQLLDAFVLTANEYAGSTIQLSSYRADIEAMTAAGGLPFRQTDAQIYWQRMEAMGYPAVHHSAAYKSAYRPAYRVIAREFLPENLQTLVAD
jgi:hypothetical protein